MDNKNNKDFPTKKQPKPQVFAHYQLLTELGQGGMGKVYKAFDHRLKRIVAIKTLIASDHASQELIHRFMIEAHSCARLQHANIVSLYEFDDQGGIYFMVMECIDGENLKQVLNKGKIGMQEGVALIEKIARAIHYAHGQGIIHRDLKPANVLINEQY